jgi:hypothetical protein
LKRINQTKTVPSPQVVVYDDRALESSQNCNAARSSLSSLRNAAISLNPKLFCQESLHFLGHHPIQRSTSSIQHTTSSPPPSIITRPHRSLSPCSQFAKEWYERKTVRRSNRKKRRSFLQPITAPTPSRAGFRSKDGERGDASDSSSLPSSSSSSSLSCQMNKHDDPNKILGPPKLRSVVTNINHPVATDGDHQAVTTSLDGPAPNVVTPAKPMEGSGCEGDESSTPAEPPPPLACTSNLWSPGLPPMLCTTPSSEDDSFVDDYW